MGKRLFGSRQAADGPGRRDGRCQGTKQSQQCQSLYNQAIQQFTLAVQLNPKSKEAFLNRGEAYQSLAMHFAKNELLKERYEERARYLSQAAQSADAASQLSRDRDPQCLELLASVIANQGEVYSDAKPPSPKNAASCFKQASYVLQEAASFPNANRSPVARHVGQMPRKGDCSREHSRRQRRAGKAASVLHPRFQPVRGQEPRLNLPSVTPRHTLTVPAP